MAVSKFSVHDVNIASFIFSSESIHGQEKALQAWNMFLSYFWSKFPV